MVLASAGIIVMASGPFYYGFGLLVDPLLTEFGWSTLAIATAFSVRSEVSAIGAPVVGFLVDRFGPSRVMAGGVLVIVAGFLLLSRITELWQFYAAVVVVSIGTNFSSSLPGSVLIARWFQRNRSRALTFLTLGGGLSGVTVPILAWAVSEAGWRNALVIWAVPLLFIGLPITLLMKDNPEDLGFYPDGAPGPRGVGAGPHPSFLIPHSSPAFTLGQALHTRAFWFLGIALALANFGTTPAFALLIPALTRSGISPEIAALAAAAIPLVSLPGRLLGLSGDRWDKRRIIAGCLGLQALGLFLLAWTTSPLWLVAFVPAFGVGFGGPIPLRSAFQAEYFGLPALGRIQGASLLIITFGGLLGPIIVGALVDLTGSYRPGFLLGAAVAALGVPLALMVG